MKIGVDLDGTLYGFPEFFVPFIVAMTAAGHKFYCTSNHRRSHWSKDRERIKQLGLDPDLIDPSLMAEEPDGAREKARMSDAVDINFDDDADKFQHLTDTPIFKCPAVKAPDRIRKLNISPLQHSLRMWGNRDIPVM